ncbi:MAG: AsmA family protein [Gammaproteobacteria bacterium]
MSKLIKVCLATVGVFVLVAIIGVISLVTLVNPNRYKNQITQQIYKSTGHQTTIGNIEWSIFPWLKLQLDNVTLSNPAGFSNTPFATVGQAAVSVDMSGLLRRELIINKIAASDVQVNLIRNIKGNNNWTMQSSAPVTAKNIAPETNTPSTNKSSIKVFAINKIAISNTTVNWQDATNNQNISFKINSFDTANINLNGVPFDVNGSFTYQANQLPQAVTIKIAANINANQNTQQYSLNNLELNLNDFAMTGNVQINQAKPPLLTANLNIPNSNLASLLSQLGQPIIFQNKSALTNVSGNMNVTVNKNNAQINQLVLNVDGANITGQLNLTQLKPLQGQYTLNIDKLNLDQYQTAANATASTPPVSSSVTTTTPAVSSNKSILPTCLQTANLTGKLNINSLQVSKMQMQQVNIPLTLKQGEIVASPITAQFYQGTLQADAKANYTTATPSYFLSSALSNINMQALLQQVANFNKLTGTGQINFLINASGNNKNAIMQGLNGNGKLQLKNGSYAGMDLMSAVTSAASLFLKQAPVAANQSAQTNFSELKASFQINNGLLANNDLSLTSPIMTVTGNGTVSLVTQLIDYNLSVEPIGDLIPQLATLLKAVGPSIPVKVTGSISHPQVSADMKQISIDATKQTIDKNLNNIGKGVDDFSKGVAKTLNNMFGK